MLRFRTHLRTVAPHLLGAALALHPGAHAAAQSLIKGVDEWAEATTQAAEPKWVGARVPFPEPSARPLSEGRLDSALAPISVHAGPGVSAARVREVLKAAEAAHALLSETGWVQSFGDGGQGGTAGHDLYVVAAAERGADAGIDATQPVWWGLDGARAFAVLDARVPKDRVPACTTQALAEALLFEQDPAEAASLRKSTAAYLAWLATGELGCDGEAEDAHQHPERAAFGREDPDARGARWLVALGHRQDLNTGAFLRDMWQFARQRTWEGHGLRASPDLFEAIDKALDLAHEDLSDVAGELADAMALPALAPGERAHPRWTELRWSALPVRLPAADPPLEPLGTHYAVVRMDRAPSEHDRIRVWSKGEYGTRWSLSVTRVDKEGRVRGRLSAPARKNPNSFVSLELDPQTAAVLISVTNVGEKLPDADEGAPFEVRSVALVVDQGRDGVLTAAELQ